MNRLLFLLLFIGLVSAPAFALKTVTAVTVSPHGAVLIQGSSLTYTTSCSYSDLSTDACVSGNAGTPTWTSFFPTCYAITSGGIATWSASLTCDPANTAQFSSGEFTAQAYMNVCYQGVCDNAGVLAQHPGDTFYPYITPDYREFQDGDFFGNNPYPLNVAVGSHPQLGLGYVYNNSNLGTTGTPGQFTCNWASSDTSKATIDRYGAVTAIAAGTVTMTCNPAGNGVLGNSTQAGWSSANGGNGINLVIVNPTPTLRHWYVRPDGGSYYDPSTASSGQCDGLSNLPAAGAVSFHCAVDNIRDLYWNNQLGTTHLWVIGPGDTVDIAPSSPASAGYNLNSDPGGGPHNCWFGGYGCYMPPVPSGTATNHTVIRGTNYASCTSDAQKTLLNGSMGGKYVLNLTDSQYVDVQCVEISQQSQCGGIFTNECGGSLPNSANDGIWISALTSGVTLTDVYIYGLASTGIFGASGYNGITMNRLHIQGMPGFGINMDDASWGTSNISVAGGMTMTNSIVEWTGCVAEHPVVHAYPYVECRDSTMNNNWSSPDGIGEGNTSGYWSFDHVIMRYNWQDGFDLLHSGMQYLSITNSQAYGNLGASYKMGPADNVQLINNVSIQNCQRMATPVGDQPAASIIPGATYCRGNDWLGFSFAATGTYIFESNSFVGYQDAPLDYACAFGYEICSTANTIFQNNSLLGYSNPTFNSGQLPGLFNYGGPIPANQGWATRDYNNYYNLRQCPTSLAAHETCNTADPAFIGEPASPIATASSLDNFNFMPTATSPLLGAGLTLPAVLTDATGLLRPKPPAIGAMEFSTASGTLNSPQILVTATPTSAAVGQTVTLVASISTIGGFVPTGSVTFLGAGAGIGPVTLNSSGVATISTASLAAGTYGISASYSGDSNYTSGASAATSLTVTAALNTPPVVTLNLSTSAIAPSQPVTFNVSVGVVGSTVPTGTVTFFAGAISIGSAALNSTGVATFTTSSLATGSYSMTGYYSGDSTYAFGSSNAATLTVSSASGAVAISVGQPDFGFNVIPSASRRLFATVTNGSTNQVLWTVTAGTATLSSNSGSWVDVTAPLTGSSCSYSSGSGGYTVSSSSTFTVEAVSVDDGTKKAEVTFNVCNPQVQISVVPFYRTLYSNQPADIQSLVVGSVNRNVNWAIKSQPVGGDGSLGDSTSRDTVFSATVPGRYTLMATSIADPTQVASATLYVTGHSIPYTNPVTPNLTEPVDCSVDPGMSGTVYEVGPSQTFHTLGSVPFPTMPVGSTVRIHNEDTTQMHPTQYHEYIQISRQATPTQPIRICGVPDSIGNLPILDAANATGRSDDSSVIGGLGLITLHNDNSTNLWPNFGGAAWILVGGIHFRNARAGYTYVAPNGSGGSWSDASACLRVNQGHAISFIGNDFDNCGTGAISAWAPNGSWGSSNLDLLWEGNHFHNNGSTTSASAHQLSLQGWGEIVQFNRIDNITTGALGANVKSRGLESILRYNYLGDGPTRQMDLVEVQAGTIYMSFSGFLGGGSLSYHATNPSDPYSADQLAAEQEVWNSNYIYGNIYQNGRSLLPIHYGMDTVGGELSRKGSLYWYNNTFYQTACAACTVPWTLFDTEAAAGTFVPQVEFPTVQAFNNVIWMDDSTKPTFQWNNYSAFIGVSGTNLLPANWGTNNMAGGLGSGWNITATTDAYQNSTNLAAHVTGFTSSNLMTASARPFDPTSWALNADVAPGLAVPPALCEMPARFSYLPNLGFSASRIAVVNVGATDTATELASEMTSIIGVARYNSHYANCR